jgi:Calcineurin-like phosphoesterase
VAAALLLFCASACRSGRSTSIRSAACCSAYQHTDHLADQPEAGVTRLAIGGDSRDDRSHVVPWAFQEARKRGAKAFVFLGDMEITSLEDRFFMPLLQGLAGIPFYPVIGNHEVELFGSVRLSSGLHSVEEFKEDFLRKPGARLAPLPEVVYSAEIASRMHFIALDNVSRRGEGFGDAQLSWLAGDLKAASEAKSIILVGMHKALAKNPITTHAMDEDGPRAVRDSDAALALFKQYGVAMLFVSHSHMYAAYNQDGIETRLTGGLGARLVKGLAEADGGLHHFLLLDVPVRGDKSLLRVEVVKFNGVPVRDDQDEKLEVEK